MLFVAEVYGLVDEQAGLGPGGGEYEEAFVFEDATDPFNQCVLVAIVAVGYRATQLGLAQGYPVGIRGVLIAAVGVVNAPSGGPTGPAHGPVQGGQAAGRVQAGVDVGADDALGKRVGDQTQVNPALAGGQVGEAATYRCLGAVGLGASLTRLGWKR